MSAPTAPKPFAGTALPITEADIVAASRSLGVDIPTIRTVMAVESAGSGFLPDGSGRPRILFEAHVFGRTTAGRWNASHPDISRAEWTTGLYLGGAAEYGRLARAVDLDRRAAIGAASWGLFQILGVNFAQAGFASVESFVAAMAVSEGQQLAAFVSFVKAGRLAAALRERRWADFARAYNGPGFAANHYDTKLASNYARLSGQAPPPAKMQPGQAMALTTIHVGDSGPLVGRLQTALRRREAQLSIDGKFGRATEAAVQRLQIENGLAADGIVGRDTWLQIVAMETRAAPLARP